MPKKILYVASTVGHLKSFHLPYLERLAQEGWTVHIAGRGADQLLPGAAAGFDVPFEKSMFSPKNLEAVRLLAGLLRREDYDAVSVHTSLAAFFTRLAVMLSGRRDILVINTVHGYLFDRDTPLFKRTLLLWAEKLTARSTDLLLTMNRQDTQIAQSNHLCPGRIVQISGMGVDFSRFEPAGAGERLRARERFGLPRDAFVLVYAAEFSKRKNQEELIRTMALLPERVCLLLAGRGEGLEPCRALAEELGLSRRVFFAGFVPDVESCYHAADLCVSTSRSEGLPFNLMEAMSCALPVVATDVKGHQDLVLPGQTGFLVPYGDREALRARVEELMDTPALFMRLGCQAREHTAPYRLETVLEENMALLEDLLGPAERAGKTAIPR